MGENVPFSAIKEANVHLQALHTRNVELESQVASMTDEMNRLQKELSDLRGISKLKEEQEKRLLGQQNIVREKDDKIDYLKGEVKRLANIVRDNSQKDMIITKLERKCQLLSEILKYKPALESVALCLEQAEIDFIDNTQSLLNGSKKDICENRAASNGALENGILENEILENGDAELDQTHESNDSLETSSVSNGQNCENKNFEVA